MQIQIDKYTWVVGERVIPHCFMVSRNVILNVVRWTQVLHGSGGQLHNCTIAQLHNCTIAQLHNYTIVCNTHGGGRPQRPVMIVATCQVAEVPLITSLLLLLPRDLSDFARLSLTALFAGNWSRIYQPALIYRVLMLMSS